MHYRTVEVRQMISPFTERGEAFGKTFGLGPCTYDFRLNHILGKHNQLLSEYTVVPGEFVLASTIEKVAFPHNICGTILDKSSMSRKGISAFNTHFDPGFIGYPTVELVNLSNENVKLVHGLPIIQMKFEMLLAETDMPYQGKYQNQPNRPVEAKEGCGAWGAAEVPA